MTKEQHNPLTGGVDHVGLSVKDLGVTMRFFCDCLGFRQIGGRPDYPAVFVSDGSVMLTLWQVRGSADAVAFDRRANVGLHHLALKAPSSGALAALHDRVAAWPGVTIDFPHEPLGAGPKIHFMAFEPGGIRIEFIWDGSSGEGRS